MPDYKKKLKNAITGNYAKQGIDVSRYSNFDMKNDTIIQGRSMKHSIADQRFRLNKKDAGITYNPKEQKTFKSTSTGNYRVTEVYRKPTSPKKTSPTNFKSNDERVAKQMFNK